MGLVESRLEQRSRAATVKALKDRLASFGLEVAEDKTQFMEFSSCKVRVKTKFDFLGFKFRWGKPIMKRRISRDKLRASLANFKTWFRKHSGLPKKILFAMVKNFGIAKPRICHVF